MLYKHVMRGINNKTLMIEIVISLFIIVVKPTQLLGNRYYMKYCIYYHQTLIVFLITNCKRWYIDTNTICHSW